MQKFLEELTKLSKKHGFVIGGCGCCGSPHVTQYKGNPSSYFNDKALKDGRYTISKDGDGGGDDLGWHA